MTTIEGTPRGAGLEILAPAKVNLALHVTARRADGYHELDSLTLFAESGDLLTVTPAAENALEIGGPRGAGLPAGDDNLCLRAARMTDFPVSVRLDKRLPAEAGLGGGSADAAAVLRAIARLSGSPLPAGTERLGADVPVCLASRATRMQGIGERLSPVHGLPPLAAVLVNPGVPVATPPVFKALVCRDNPPLEALPETPCDTATLIAWLARQRNDLEAPAITIAPVIATVIDTLAASPACQLARMSGSGASCFGLYPDRAASEAAAAKISAKHPEWWVKPAILR
ncbi:4-(cytidine 5'-diphospho)-2-C-methyl-D-erythritol kinase [Pseudooceanicola sp. CBS1P-1]|uniref:4-diphosphocytidyl-2-C-methyl-D-erythritol kinase n=1 Tax=Pseudooceanicola albus TaxID=2692189 RepID=A0A6L7G2C0_9RHOB|nr:MULTISPECIES: 4-(cytidine 5'-diphospho)-2-C-methyl-D-erythritol kinase [Pseudooceanicola]MBT9384845.1 4-(cytidine 5'-diphospho)-2-C-methyl-D-erythritol kinase [Pseudooceanicola endophyticus]MXN18161.1 4-(cytidine 5'-diphospho)-2-C-methyl-D-erythritol kinase [Pseudooceanicola albus]